MARRRPHRAALQAGKCDAANINPAIGSGKKTLLKPDNRRNDTPVRNVIDRAGVHPRALQQGLNQADIVMPIEAVPSHASRDHGRTCLLSRHYIARISALFATL
jgi:hypothetical protein